MKHLDFKKAVVVFSGGQDSTTCLLKAIQEVGAENVTTLSVNYGQRHKVELECAKKITAMLGVKHEIIETDILKKVGDSALVTPGADVAETKDELPASFVPGRNILLLTIAAAVAYKLGAGRLYTGVCETDYSGYPDCRAATIDALETTLSYAMDTAFTIYTPLMLINKAETFDMAARLGGLDLILEHTHTCYEGDHTTKNEWGYGCGKCPACTIRARGWEEYKEMGE